MFDLKVFGINLEIYFFQVVLLSFLSPHFQTNVVALSKTRLRLWFNLHAPRLWNRGPTDPLLLILKRATFRFSPYIDDFISYLVDADSRVARGPHSFKRLG